MLDLQTETRGVSSLDGPIALTTRVIASLIDLSFVLIFYCISVISFHLSPLPGAVGLGVWIALGAGWILGQRAIFERTLGEWLWGIGPSSTGKLLQKKHLRGSALSQALVGTGVSATLTLFLFQHAILSHPVLQSIEIFSEAGELNEETRALPFYYVLLNWPIEFAGKPIFTTLPYEKGPPKKFPGRIISHWQSPEIQMTLQGPITPENAPPRDLLRECAVESRSLACLNVRNQMLIPEMAEIRAMNSDSSGDGGSQWKIAWLETTGISGFWLEQESLRRTLIRAILVNHNGTQQRFTLNYPTGTLHGKRARTLFVGILKSASFQEDLQKSRSGIQAELSKIRLTEIERNAGQSTFQKQVASIQATLIAKITTDPADFEAYYHLAGTSALLRRRAGIEVLEITQPLIEAMGRYAQDIAPQDIRTAQMINLLKD